MTFYLIDIEDLKRTRLALHMSLTYVANSIRVSVPTLKNYENKRTPIPLHVYLNLCSLYDNNPMDFIDVIDSRAANVI